MKILKTFKKRIGKAPDSETTDMRSMVIMQRSPHTFSKRELQAAAERGWGRPFNGIEDPMYFVSAEGPALVVVKAGPHITRITCLSGPYAEDDAYALSQLPQPEQKRAWMEHHACAFLEFFNDLSSQSRIPDPAAYASLARLALQLGDANCAVVFLPMKNLMFPNDGTAEEGLRLLMRMELPLNR